MDRQPRFVGAGGPVGADQGRAAAVVVRPGDAGGVPCAFALDAVLQCDAAGVGELIADRQRGGVFPKVRLIYPHERRGREGQRLLGHLPREIGYLDVEDVFAAGVGTQQEDHRHECRDVENALFFILYFGLAAESEIGEGDSLDDFGIVEQIEFRNAQHAQYGRRNIDFQTGNASRYMDVDGGGVGELVVVVHGDFVRLVDILSGPVERRSFERSEDGRFGALVELACGERFVCPAFDGDRTDPGCRNHVYSQFVVAPRHDVEEGVDVVGVGSRALLEAQRDDVRRSGLAECKPGSRVRNVEVDALGRERLGFVLRSQQQVADFVGIGAAFHLQIENRGQAAESESDWFAFVGFARFGIGETQDGGRQRVGGAVESVAALGAQVPERDAGFGAVYGRMGIESHVLPRSGLRRQFPFECEVAVVVSERPEFRGGAGSGEKNSHGVVVFPVSGECAFSDGDAGAGFGVVGDIGAEFYERVAGVCRIVRLVVTAAARGQCGRSEDCQSFIGVFHSCAVFYSLSK